MQQTQFARKRNKAALRRFAEAAPWIRRRRCRGATCRTVPDHGPASTNVDGFGVRAAGGCRSSSPCARACRLKCNGSSRASPARCDVPRGVKALGRVCGGLCFKLHARADDLGRVLRLIPISGNPSDPRYPTARTPGLPALGAALDRGCVSAALLAAFASQAAPFTCRPSAARSIRSIGTPGFTPDATASRTCSPVAKVVHTPPSDVTKHANTGWAPPTSLPQGSTSASQNSVTEPSLLAGSRRRRAYRVDL